MNKKNCEQIMEDYLMLDKYERVPLKITLHLLMCKKCRTQVHYMALAEKYAGEPIRNTPLKDLLDNMQIKPVSMTKWIICGILMVLFMMFFGIFLNNMNEDYFAIIFNILFGLLITVYSTLFVGTNIDFFIKKIEKKHTAK